MTIPSYSERKVHIKKPFLRIIKISTLIHFFSFFFFSLLCFLFLPAFAGHNTSWAFHPLLQQIKERIVSYTQNRAASNSKPQSSKKKIFSSFSPISFSPQLFFPPFHFLFFSYHSIFCSHMSHTTRAHFCFEKYHPPRPSCLDQSLSPAPPVPVSPLS